MVDKDQTQAIGFRQTLMKPRAIGGLEEAPAQGLASRPASAAMETAA